jgi:DNA phosphorothioation-dependent restriction protein DptG
MLLRVCSPIPYEFFVFLSSPKLHNRSENSYSACLKNMTNGLLLDSVFSDAFLFNINEFLKMLNKMTVSCLI